MPRMEVPLPRDHITLSTTCPSQPSNSHHCTVAARVYLQNLGNGAVEAELALRVVLVLQLLQAILAPCLATIPLRRVLIAEGVVDVCVHDVLAAGLEENLAKLRTEGRRLRVKL